MPLIQATPYPETWLGPTISPIPTVQYDTSYCHTKPHFAGCPIINVTWGGDEPPINSVPEMPPLGGETGYFIGCLCLVREEMSEKFLRKK